MANQYINTTEADWLEPHALCLQPPAFIVPGQTTPIMEEDSP